MGIEHKSTKLKVLYEKIDKKEIVLPNFQRGFVWSIDEQHKLIASTIVQIPIGSTLHLKGKDNAFAARALCEREAVKPTVSECEYVLDGQQRLSTLKNAFYDIYNSSSGWKKTWSSLFSNLRVRWFISLNQDDDFFGLDSLKFETEKILESEPRELLDSIISKKILGTKEQDKWYHPGYLPKDSDGKLIVGSNEKKLHIAEHAKNENLIPLYEVYLGNDGIHNKIIEMVSSRQVELLKVRAKDKLANSEQDYKDYIVNILSSIESNISSIFSQLDEDAINTLFDELGKTWARRFSTFMEKLLEIDMPIILLEQKEAGRAAAIFEEINKGGTALSIYDLLVAKAANADSSQTSLTDRIIEILAKEYNITDDESWNSTCMTDIKDNMLTSKFQSMYLNALSILVAKKKNDEIDKTIISRNYVLNLSADEINSNNSKVIESIIRAYYFLQFYCGVINEKNIIYDYMILPIIYFLENDNIWKNKRKIKILEAWYWSWLFSGKYKERQDDQFVKDIEYLKKILVDDNEININDFLNDRIFNAPDYSNQETILHKNEASDFIAPKAMKDAILQYVLSRKPQDFIPDNTITLTALKAACNDEKNKDKNCKNYKLQIHHIIPLGIVTAIGESTDTIRGDKTHILNSPMNLTYISECANGAISDMEFNKYKTELGAKIASHLLTLTDYDSKQKIEDCLDARFVQMKTTLNAEITELITTTSY